MFGQIESSSQSVDSFLESLLGENRRVLPLTAGHSVGQGSDRSSEALEPLSDELRDTTDRRTSSTLPTVHLHGGLHTVSDDDSAQPDRLPSSDSGDVEEGEPMLPESGTTPVVPSASPEPTPPSPNRGAHDPRKVFLVPTLQMSLRQSFIRALTAVNSNIPVGDKNTHIQQAITVLNDEVSENIFDINTSSLRHLLARQYKDGDRILADVLSIKRNSSDPRPATTVGKVLLAAWKAFSAENPASLMRPYVFLQQLLEPAVTFVSPAHEKSTQDALADIAYVIKEFRSVLKAVYPFNPDSNYLSVKMVVNNIERLKELAKEHSSFAIHARLLALFILDKLHDSQLNQISIKMRWWLLTGSETTVATGATSLNKEMLLSSAAQALQQAASPINILAYRTALAEISAYQHAYHPEDFRENRSYTLPEHEEKVNKFISHIEHCEAKYFAHPILTMQADSEKIALTRVASALVAEEAEEVITFDDNTSAKKYKKRLRLVNNLGAIQQVALHWGVEDSLTTQTTLALMSVSNEDALRARAISLSKQETYIERVNSILILSTLDGDIAELQQLYEKISSADIATGKFVEKAIDASISEDKKLRYFQAFLDFANSALRYLKDEQAKLNTGLKSESDLVKLYSTIYKCLSYLQSVMMTREVQADVALLNQLREAVKSKIFGWQNENMPLLGAKIPRALQPSFELHSPEDRILLLALQTALQAQDFRHKVNLTEVITRAETYDALDQRAKSFVSKMGAIHLDNNIGENNSQIIGQTIFNGNPNPHSPLELFQINFANALKRKDVDFFIRMLFTLAHHPLPIPSRYDDFVKIEKNIEGIAQIISLPLREELKQFLSTDENTARILCYAIASGYELPVYQALWNEFATRGFYGNNTACESLIKHYLVEGANEQTLRNLILIITFVLNHPSFANPNSHEEHLRQVKFSQSLLEVFVQLLRLVGAERLGQFEEIRELHFALLRLDAGKRLIDINEYENLAALLSLKQHLSSRSRKTYRSLWLKAQQQNIVHRVYDKTKVERQDNTLLGLDIAYVSKERGQERVKHFARQEAIKVAMIDWATALPEIQNNIAKLNQLVDKIIDICFPKGYRYYQNCPDITNENKKNYKLTFSDSRGRAALMQKCRDKLKALLDANTLHVDTLKEAMDALRREVLQGGLETGEPNSHYERIEALPHALPRLETKDFGATQSDTAVLNGWITSINKEIDAISQASNIKKEARKSVRINLLAAVLPAEAGIGDDDAEINVIEEVTEADKIAAIYTCISWLTSEYGSPTPSNVPRSVAKVIPEIVATEVDDREYEAKQNRIIYYRDLLFAINATNKFEHRIDLIDQLDLRGCIDHVLTDENSCKIDDNWPSSAPFNMSELYRFLHEFDFDENKGQYDTQRDQFVWAIAQAYVLQPNGDGDDKDFVLDVLATCDYPWHRIVALGFQYYVSLSEVQRWQNGDAMLRTVINLTQKYLKQTECNDVIQHREAVVRAALDELEKIRKKESIIPSDLIEVYKETGQSRSSVKMRTDVAVYFYIYVLAQAWMHFTPPVDSTNDIKKQMMEASLLLKRFDDLKGNLELSFDEWHHKMLLLGKNYPESFLYVLVKGHTYNSFDKSIYFSQGTQNDTGCIDQAKKNLTCVYTQFYGNASEVRNTFIQTAYEQHAEAALRFLANQPLFIDISSGEMPSTLLDQVAFIFDVMRDVVEIFDDEDVDWSEINRNSPHLNALYALANGKIDLKTLTHDDRHTLIKKEVRKIMRENLFPKACAGFNHLMQSSVREKQVVNARTAVLLENVKTLLKSCGYLRDQYVQDAAVNFLSADDTHVRFVLSLVNLPLSEETRGIVDTKLLPKLYDLIHQQLASVSDEDKFSEQLQSWLQCFQNNTCLTHYAEHILNQAVSVIDTFTPVQRARYATVMLWCLCCYNQNLSAHSESIQDFIVTQWNKSWQNSSRSFYVKPSKRLFHDQQTYVLKTLCREQTLPDTMQKTLRKFCRPDSAVASLNPVIGGGNHGR